MPNLALLQPMHGPLNIFGREWTPVLVSQVVDRYISCNNSINGLEQGDVRLSMWSELEEREIPAAESLIQYNVERRGVVDDDRTW